MAINIPKWKKQYAKRNPADFPRVNKITNKQLASRDNFYRRAGFTSWERFWLISQTADNPAMKALAAERRGARRQARVDGLSFLEFQRGLTSDYRERGFTFAATGRFNPFRFIDEAIDALDDEEYKKMRRKMRQAKKGKSHKDIAKNSRRRGPEKKPRKVRFTKTPLK